MHNVDSHFHWLPRSYFEELCKRTTFPRAERNGKGGYRYYRALDGKHIGNPWPEWFDLDKQFAYMESIGHEVDVVSSIGPYSVYFSEVPASEGAAAATQWNEEMAAAQRAYPGRFWGTAAMTLVDTATAVDLLEHAAKLGLKGVNLPSSIGTDPRIDAERLEPFYARAEELGLPLFLHPTDAMYSDTLSEDYGGALHATLGRVMEVSIAAMRLIFSGIMERHPRLTVVMSHTGGALPYQAGRLDKNGNGAKLPELPSTYLKRMYTDVVSPHALGIKFAMDFFGIDHIFYGTDYPCWEPLEAMRLFDEVGLDQEARSKVL
jgi:aminocarboxymuconate-semialdehyde decarboxylase